MTDISTKELLKGKKRIHFMGIGGSGMYPLVQILHSKGYIISGSDNNEGDTIDAEREMGITIHMGHDPKNFEGADLIVHTAAILPDNPELVAARASGIPVVERSVLLGAVSADYEKAICVSGTHGKTTVTSMITQILMETPLDPTVVIGGKLDAIGGNGRAGSSEYMVCEACEFVDTFLKLHPYLSLILNIDADHMEYFKCIENSIRSFNRFAKLATGMVLANGSDENTKKALEGIERPIVLFGWDDSCDYYPKNISVRISGEAMVTAFELMHKGEKVTDIELKIPGRHNVINAVAACAAVLEMGVEPEMIVKGLAKFRGAHRRFEILGHKNGVTIADDYAHHPAEVEVTLKAAKELGFKKVWAVFQPFTYSRTAMLLDDFARVLSIADRVVLSEIMGSREKNTYNIYAKDLCDKIDGCVWFPTFEEMAEYTMANAEAGDLVITLGCGDVYKCAKMMLKQN
ncbi:MAG: UDP-N-acetylmuramate--L-alanine ligase [Oscillospiraceae bacterium]|nr:UDP-N-acetylmuramate--L-alanine ligase [Oscillospiraceae bacterium]